MSVCKGLTKYGCSKNSDCMYINTLKRQYCRIKTKKNKTVKNIHSKNIIYIPSTTSIPVYTYKHDYINQNTPYIENVFQDFKKYYYNLSQPITEFLYKIVSYIDNYKIENIYIEMKKSFNKKNITILNKEFTNFKKTKPVIENVNKTIQYLNFIYGTSKNQIKLTSSTIFEDMIDALFFIYNYISKKEEAYIAYNLIGKFLFLVEVYYNNLSS